ncbi:hypothetical protein L917_21649 [Phytophthora nicotianae]|uniref:Uncharacterized protein n=1 Tax=Phytophthora nicotianae TaxID=4792 RepID=W2JWW6_PHYNI|nr:hypothetical protein L917_21649 [Phytophthora nicotianae]
MLILVGRVESHHVSELTSTSDVRGSILAARISHGADSIKSRDDIVAAEVTATTTTANPLRSGNRGRCSSASDRWPEGIPNWSRARLNSGEPLSLPAVSESKTRVELDLPEELSPQSESAPDSEAAGEDEAPLLLRFVGRSSRTRRMIRKASERRR